MIKFSEPKVVRYSSGASVVFFVGIALAWSVLLSKAPLSIYLDNEWSDLSRWQQRAPIAYMLLPFVSMFFLRILLKRRVLVAVDSKCLVFTGVMRDHRIQIDDIETVVIVAHGGGTLKSIKIQLKNGQDYRYSVFGTDAVAAEFEIVIAEYCPVLLLG